MRTTSSFVAIIGIAAFAGNMINIGLSYGIHWLSLEPFAFMETFAVDFPLLLFPTAATLLPALIATLILYIKSERETKAKRYWLYALIGLLIINIQTAAYHLPLNLDFMANAISLDEVSGQLRNWLILHWVRVIIALISAGFAIKGFVKTIK